jgi:protein-arginine kinase activator protein McsA
MKECNRCKFESDNLKTIKNEYNDEFQVCDECFIELNLIIKKEHKNKFDIDFFNKKNQ